MAKCSTPSRMRRAFVENDKSLQILERNGICDTIYRYANTIPLCSDDNSCIKPISSTVADRNKQAIRDIRAVMQKIADSIYDTKSASNSPYIQQRLLINGLFADTAKHYGIKPVASIMQRLIVIDSLYSTNASYSYFSFENMAKAIMDLGEESDAIKHFAALVTGDAKTDDKLFSSCYGIRKNLAQGSRQMSLMTKYAYYQLAQEKEAFPLGFPIYDSLVIAVYPKICSWIFNTENKLGSSSSIASYINSLNVLRSAIFNTEGIQLVYGIQQYDLLDAYMWRMGKMEEGNYSLLFDEEDYKRMICNIGLSANGVSNYEEKLYQLFKHTLCDGKRLVTSVNKTLKNGETSKQYKYDFNALVRCQCAKMKTEDILDGVKNNLMVMKALIDHWKEYYKPQNDYKTHNE